MSKEAQRCFSGKEGQHEAQRVRPSSVYQNSLVHVSSCQQPPPMALTKSTVSVCLLWAGWVGGVVYRAQREVRLSPHIGW